ncbi:protein of unknown function DUF3447 - like 10 [Theobroma cacao]|nr:protein of unknown function DUF3447 - like 10 [Theobroma cacao]
MNLKPSFARKLNQSGFSPLHLALQNKREKMVADLLSIDKNLVRVKGREGYTPLHHAAKEGNYSLLSTFLEKCPSSILDISKPIQVVQRLLQEAHLKGTNYLPQKKQTNRHERDMTQEQSP